MNYLILLNDGYCVEVQSDTKNNAIVNLWNQYDVPYEDFINDISFIEWSQNNVFHLMNLQTGLIDFNQKSKLKRYLTISELKPNKTTIKEEFDYIYE